MAYNSFHHNKMTEYYKEEFCTPTAISRAKLWSVPHHSIAKQKHEPPSSIGTVAMNRQRLQVLFSDVENLLLVHKTCGIQQLRAAFHLEKVDGYLEQLDEISYTQLLTAHSLNKVQQLKLELEILACELVQYID